MRHIYENGNFSSDSEEKAAVKKSVTTLERNVKTKVDGQEKTLMNGTKSTTAATNSTTGEHLMQNDKISMTTNKLIKVRVFI